MTRTYRIGLIVPSSNTTMETEIPELLRRRERAHPERFTFHSSRTRLKQVTKEELARMVEDSDRCAGELADARVDAIAYACLVALMSQPAGFHSQVEERLHRVTAESGAPTPIVSSAGALVEALRALGATRITLVAPYLKPITSLVIEYLTAVGDRGGRLQKPGGVGQPGGRPTRSHATSPRSRPSSTCATRTPSFSPRASRCRRCPPSRSPRIVSVLPVLSAGTATVFCLLRELGLEPIAPDAGALLAGARVESVQPA